MATASSPRADATRAALLGAALEEFAQLGFRRGSMEGVARRAGVSRATLYTHHGGKEELFRALVAQLHEDHLAAMAEALAAPGLDFERRVVAVLEARFGTWVALAATSPHAAELYDQHSRLCGDVASASQQRSEGLLAGMLREAARAGEVDLKRLGLSAPRAAGVLFDCAHGAKGEEPAGTTPARFSERLRRIVHVLVAGFAPAGAAP